MKVIKAIKGRIICRVNGTIPPMRVFSIRTAVCGLKSVVTEKEIAMMNQPHSVRRRIVPCGIHVIILSVDLNFKPRVIH